MSVAVADAGPLIHLGEIDCLGLLRLFDTLYVPEAVWSEIAQPSRVRESDLLALGMVRRHRLASSQTTRFVDKHNMRHLQAGECEALCLCWQIDVKTLLTDDLAVRHKAQELGIVSVGSLGVVVGAYHKGEVTLDQAEQYLQALYSVSSLFVTQTIVELAIEKLRSRNG